MPSYLSTCRSLANTFAADELREDIMVENTSSAYCEGRKPRWLRPLARHIEKAFLSEKIRPRVREIEAEIIRSKSFARSWKNGKVDLGTNRLPGSSRMVPAKGRPRSWKVPVATNLGELSRLLELHIDESRMALLCIPAHQALSPQMARQAKPGRQSPDRDSQSPS